MSLARVMMNTPLSCIATGVTDLIRRNAACKAHPVVPGSPICGMRMPSAAGARGHLAIGVSTVPLGQKAEDTGHRHADKQLKAPEKLETHPPFQISLVTPIC